MPIRRLELGDHPALLDLWTRAGLTTIRPRGRDSREEFRRQEASGVQTVLGLEEEGRLVGAVVAGHDGRKGWIHRLAVDPAVRRRGCARRLVAEAEAILRDRGIRIIAALVEDGNAPSLALFEGEGYVPARDVVYLSKRDSPET